MEKTTKKPKSKLKRLIAGLTIAYGLNWTINMGFAIYHEHKLRNCPAVNNYHIAVVGVEKKRLNQLRNLYRVNKAEEGLNAISLYLERHSLGEKLQGLDNLGIATSLNQDKNQLERQLEEFEKEKEELRIRFLEDEEYSRHSEALDQSLIRGWVNPFYKRFDLIQVPPSFF